MIEFNCENCGCFYRVEDGYSGGSVKCKKCSQTMSVPVSPSMSFGYVENIDYGADGMTPDFDELFMALSKEEREAPTIH